MPPTEDDARADLQLVQRTLAGDHDARLEFTRRMGCIPRILSAINGRRGFAFSSHDLEDLTQDTLLKILEKLETFAGHTTLEYWAHRFCQWEMMNRVRRRGRRSAALEAHPLEEVEDNVDSRAAMDEHGLADWLERMDAREAESVRLKLFEHKSFEEIGALLQVPSATAKSRYYRGIAWLQQQLGRREEAQQ